MPSNMPVNNVVVISMPNRVSTCRSYETKLAHYDCISLLWSQQIGLGLACPTWSIPVTSVLLSCMSPQKVDSKVTFPRRGGYRGSTSE
jgi:hypothetical protein